MAPSHRLSGTRSFVLISDPEADAAIGQPADVGDVDRKPAALCVELKSLKLYLQRYRDQGAFYETVVNRLLDDFVRACQPTRCRVVGAFTPRGGITTTVTCIHEAVK